MNKNAQELLDIGKLVFAFASVNRGTYYPDGVRRESDTDHTVMLSVCACAIADRFYKKTLDIGQVAQFTIVHDLVESYAGDTDTFNISDADRVLKEERERKALERIAHEFQDGYSWIPSMIYAYEAQSTPEARFVKVTDKLMTKLTHLMNGGIAFKDHNATRDDVMKQFSNQLTSLQQTYGTEFPEVIDILRYLTDNILQEMYV